MNEYNVGVLTRLIHAIDDCQKGEIEIDDMQARLQSALTLLETAGDAARHAVRLAGEDLEEIRFTMLLEEQRPAAVFRLDDLRATLSDVLSQG